MTETQKLCIMGYNIFADDISMIKIDPEKKLIINTINPHSYATTKKDKAFKEALQASDTLLPDGKGIVLAAKHIKKKAITKITGPDLHIHLLKQLNEKGGRCFYMGSSPEILEKIEKRLALEFPDVQAGFYSPPYKKHFSDEDNREILAAINTFKPDVLFVGMTAPKQEKWLDEHKNDIDFSIACSVGAAFDFYAGMLEHLDWFPRFLNEPKRMSGRTFVSIPTFLADMMLYKTGIKKK